MTTKKLESIKQIQVSDTKNNQNAIATSSPPIIQNPDISVVKKDTIWGNTLDPTNSLKITFVETNTPALKELSFKIRYQSYIDRKEIDQNNKHLFQDNFDNQPNATTYLLKYEDTFIATTRLITKKRRNYSLPSIPVYEEALKPYEPDKNIIVESCRTAILPEFRKLNLSILLPIFKLVARVSLENKATYVLASVRKSHVRIYKKMLWFKDISAPKLYPGVNVQGVLMLLDLQPGIIKMKQQQPQLYDYIFEKPLLLNK